MNSKNVKYANRDTEYRQIVSYLNNNEKLILIETYPASGITTFMKHKLDVFFFSIFGKNKFYIDLKNNNNLGNALFSLLVKSDHRKKFQKIANHKLGTQSESLFSSLIGCTPNIGSFIKRLLKHKLAEQIYVGDYSSAMEEFLILFFSRSLIKKYLIIIDAIECISEASHDLFLNLLQCKNLFIILIKTEQTKNYLKFENYLYDYDITIQAKIFFNRPCIKLIKEIGALYNVELDTEKSQDIIERHKQNIHEIISEIRNYDTNVECKNFTKIEEEIISILDIWSEPLDEKFIFEIISFSEILFLENINSLREILNKMEENGILIHDQSSWQLSGRNSLYIQKILNNVPNKLVYKNMIYTFLKDEKYKYYNIPLRYRISKDLLISDSVAARLYMRQLLMIGKVVPEDVFSSAELKKGNKKDCLFAGIKYCRERKYSKAFEWIESIANDQPIEDIEAFKASLLNRVRKSKEAEFALIHCLDKKENGAQQNLLGAFLISNYIHMENLTRAREVFNEMKNLYIDAPNYGYFIRNAISAFKEYRNDLYEQALNFFARDKDDFGYYTTLCNQGYSLCKNGSYEKSLSLLKEAYQGLKRFPKTNLHIINNDLGLCYFLLGEYDNAFRYLLLAQNLGQNLMPRIFATINLACTQAFMCNTKEAVKNLISIEKEVQEHPLDRVRQKYYINRLLVEYLNGNKDLNFLIEKAEKYPDRYNPEQTSIAIKTYKNIINVSDNISLSECKKLFSPCGLVYWYIDPLKLLPAGII